MDGYFIWKRRRHIFLLLAAAVFFCCSCSGREPERQMGIEGYAYVAEELDDGFIEGMKAEGGSLYYLKQGEVSELVKVSFKEDGQSRKAILARAGNLNASSWNAGKKIDIFTVDGSQAVYYLLTETMAEGTFQDYTVKLTGAWLVKQQDGTEIYRTAVEGIEDVGGFVSMEEDGEGHLFMLTEDEIWMADTDDGKVKCATSLEGMGSGDDAGTRKLLQGPGGEVYYYIDIRGDVRVLYKVTVKGESFTLEQEEWKGWSSESMGLMFGTGDSFLYANTTDGILYRYSGEDGSWYQELRWSDSNVGSDVLEVAQVSDGRLAAYFFDGKIYVLNKTAAENLPEKEQLVIAAMGSVSYDLSRYVTEFNKNNDRYHVTVDIYERTDEDLARLDAKLASSNPPDLLDLTYMDEEKYANKQVLEDLRGYLEGSARLTWGDFLENILQGHTLNGRLVCIPDSFRVNVLIGRTSQVGDEHGWTAEELMRLTEENPEYALMRYRSFNYTYYLVEEYVLDEYVDWEAGECSFDSSEFQELMEWLAMHTKGIDIVTEGNFYDTNGVLLWRASLAGWEGIVHGDAVFECDTTIKGYPTRDGEASYYAYLEDGLGIVSGSACKEGAWEFLEGFLDREDNLRLSAFFSSQKDILEKQLAEGMTDSPWPRSFLQTADGTVDVYSITQEQADLLREIINSTDFTPKGGLRGEVTGIILSELRLYLTGNKSIGEVAGIIQNRVRNLLQENMAVKKVDKADFKY